MASLRCSSTRARFPPGAAHSARLARQRSLDAAHATALRDGSWLDVWKGDAVVQARLGRYLTELPLEVRGFNYVWFPRELEKQSACFFRALYAVLAIHGRDAEIPPLLVNAAAEIVHNSRDAAELLRGYVRCEEVAPANALRTLRAGRAMLIVRLSSGHWSAVVPVQRPYMHSRSASVLHIDDAKQSLSTSLRDGAALIAALRGDDGGAGGEVRTCVVFAVGDSLRRFDSELV